MITLYTFGPYFGLPDASPFVTKAMLLLKFAALPFQEDRNGYRQAPKGKLPYLNDAGTIVADSTLIRFYIEKKYGFDFDVKLTPEQKATAWAVEKMCEEHLYLALLATRWLDPENFAKGPAQFFRSLPAPLRLLLPSMVRRKIDKTLNLQGFGRHTREEQALLAIRDIDALATLIGDTDYLMGNDPCGADAAIFAFVAGALTPVFTTPLRSTAESYPNLINYRDRILRLYFKN
ncbi:MAG TPA: glutathione S-transferase family protein [Methylocella sp.]|nr:glutathione S-transferase family protein [Methylocella sp.]